MLENQMRLNQANCNLLWDYLALTAKELDEGDFANVSIKGLVTQGRTRRSQAGGSMKKRRGKHPKTAGCSGNLNTRAVRHNKIK